jgi:hypothetical protein
MDQAECVSADWRTIGFEDGTAGRNQGQIGEYRRQCADHGVTPNLVAYQRGYNEGVRNFCTESNGFNHARSGGRYSGVCPGELEPDFLAGYRLGREHYLLARAVNKLNARIDGSQSRIRSLEDEIAQKTLKIASDETSGDTRLELLLEIKNHTLEIAELKEKIKVYQSDLSLREAEYAALEKPVYY